MLLHVLILTNPKLNQTHELQGVAEALSESDHTAGSGTVN